MFGICVIVVIVDSWIYYDPILIYSFARGFKVASKGNIGKAVNTISYLKKKNWLKTSIEIKGLPFFFLLSPLPHHGIKCQVKFHIWDPTSIHILVHLFIQQIFIECLCADQWARHLNITQRLRYNTEIKTAFLNRVLTVGNVTVSEQVQ